MARTTFSGPIKSGTIQYTTGTTLGTDRANVGFTAVSKMAPNLINYNDTTATATGLIIPAYSQIIGISIFVETLWNASSTSTLALGDGADNATDIAAAHNIAAGAIGPLRMLQSATERWKVGATDIELFAIVVTNSANAGTARIEATYLQDYWNDSARPV
tara:strand:- start:223 stop:702 length:480 start_codon:yes stop_codon:yes gene_type:complete